MARRRTTPAKHRGEFIHHLRVHSPRIFWIDTRKACCKVFKFAVFLIIFAAIALVGQRAWMRFVYHNPEFRLTQIELPEGCGVSAHRVIEAGEINLEESIFAIDTDELEERLLTLPEVKQAKAYIRYPGELKVDIVERVPVAWIECATLGVKGRDAMRGLLIDQEKKLYSCAPEIFEKVAQLPVIKLPSIQRADLAPGMELGHVQGLRAYALLQKATSEGLGDADLPEFESIAVRSENTLEAVFPDKSRVIFGLFDHKRQLDDLVVLRMRALETGRALESANLIPKRNIPVTFVSID